jgi:hypothetical protein
MSVEANAKFSSPDAGPEHPLSVSGGAVVQWAAGGSCFGLASALAFPAGLLSLLAREFSCLLGLRGKQGSALVLLAVLRLPPQALPACLPALCASLSLCHQVLRLLICNQFECSHVNHCI